MRHEVIVSGSSLAFEGGFFGFSSVVLVRGPEGPVLFDTGHHVTRGLLLAGLERAGVAPGDIGTVVLSHLHFDHVGNVDLFAGARILVGARELAYAAAPHPGDGFVPAWILGQLGGLSLETLPAEGEIASGLMHWEAPGHTPGLQVLGFTGEDGAQVVLASDAVKTVREAIAGRSDMVFATEAESRASIARITSRADRIVPGHHPELVRGSGGWLWEPAPALGLVVR